MKDNNEWATAVQIRYLNEAETAKLLGWSQRTLQQRRYHGEPPAYYKVGGRSIRYREDELIEFIELIRFDNSDQNSCVLAQQREIDQLREALGALWASTIWGAGKAAVFEAHRQTMISAGVEDGTDEDVQGWEALRRTVKP